MDDYIYDMFRLCKEHGSDGGKLIAYAKEHFSEEQQGFIAKIIQCSFNGGLRLLKECMEDCQNDGNPLGNIVFQELFDNDVIHYFEDVHDVVYPPKPKKLGHRG
jgi:hypothetical protein